MLRSLFIAALLTFAPPALAVEFDDARHLLARTGFGAPTWAEIEALRSLDYEAAVDRLLDGVGAAPTTPPPPWIDEPPPPPELRRRWSQDERRAFRRRMRERGHALKVWWCREMLSTRSPLTERLVLFWHGHFTSSLAKVKWPAALYAQQQVFRAHVHGNFGDLLRAVARDPAMLVYLDGLTNRVGEPNENFARELLELFTLGEGRGYTESDIQEAARAFTGWTVSRRATFTFDRRAHDAGVKSFLGRSGQYDGDDIIDILLAQHRLAVHVTERLWLAFVSDRPDPAEVRHLAAVFRDSGYELRPLLKGLLMSAAFRDPANRGTMIKSPVDFTIGTLRLLHLEHIEPMKIARLNHALGQDLFDPPNVKGWPGGTAWITTATLPLRQQVLHRLTRGAEMGRARMAAAGSADKLERVPPEVLTRLVLAIPPAEPPPAGMRGRALLGHLLLDPAYQLK